MSVDVIPVMSEELSSHPGSIAGSAGLIKDGMARGAKHPYFD